jgi:hypothetical protein
MYGLLMNGVFHTCCRSLTHLDISNCPSITNEGAEEAFAKLVNLKVSHFQASHTLWDEALNNFII